MLWAMRTPMASLIATSSLTTSCWWTAPPSWPTSASPRRWPAERCGGCRGRRRPRRRWSPRRDPPSARRRTWRRNRSWPIPQSITGPTSTRSGSWDMRCSPAHRLSPAGEIEQLMAAQLTATPPPLRRRRADVPAALERLLYRCLAKEPNDRPASAREIVRALQNSDAMEPPPLRRGWRRVLSLGRRLWRRNGGMPQGGLQ